MRYLVAEFVIGRKERSIRESEFASFGSVGSFDDEHGVV